jgi:hypothetical protein
MVFPYHKMFLAAHSYQIYVLANLHSPIKGDLWETVIVDAM